MRSALWLTLLVLVACNSGVPDPSLFRSEQSAEDATDSAIGTDALAEDADGTQTDAIADVADADGLDAPDVGTDAVVIDTLDAGTDAIVDTVTPDAGTDAIIDAADAGTDAIADVQPDIPPDVFLDPCIGKNCNDGIACTTDTCANGGCVHTPVNSACDDSTTCTTDLCNAATGCAHPSDGTTCDDGNVCTSDVCTSGNGATGCSHSNVGGTCDDGNACTTADTCTAGTCKGAGPVCGDGACTCGETTASCAADCPSGPPAGMVLIPAGTFWMGCNATKDSNCQANEKPQHKVTLSAYYMDLTETTVAQYKACVDAGVCTAPSTQSPKQYATYPGFPNNPVNFVNWMQSQQYCQWRGAGFDLPTEAQWEMAARGSCEKNGSTAGDAGCAAAMRTYPWGETAPSASYAVFNVSSTAAAGLIPAGDSPYGVHDMAGNVYEWNRDWLGSTYYGSSPATDPYDNVSATFLVSRGGSFLYDALYLRAGFRYGGSGSVAFQDFGLRCMRSYPTNPCGNTLCDGDETVASCPADCSFLVKHLGGACTTPGSKDTCDHGYFCVARSTAGGGNVCVADISTWAPIADSHPASDFTEATDYVTDSKTGLSWAKVPLAAVVWSTALTACNTVAYGGFTDWRVPTRAELLSLTDRAALNPASSAPNLAWPMGGLDYWSTVPTFGGGGYAWSLAFVDGTAYYYASINSWPVRCVRGGSSSGTGTGARFAAQDSGATVLDRISGLHWQQGFSAAVMTQTAGLSWCTANTPALPGSGWRLPTSHELEDLVDTQAWSPVTDVVFADAVGDSFWSATLSVLGGEACHVQLGGGGGSHFSLTTSTQRARCVR